MTEKDLAETQKFTSLFTAIDLYFPLGESNYIKTDETTKFFNEATAYLAAHKDKKLLLTGYTDNSGPDEVNLRLSRERADEVKTTLRKSGIPLGSNHCRCKRGGTVPKRITLPRWAVKPIGALRSLFSNSCFQLGSSARIAILILTL